MSLVSNIKKLCDERGINIDTLGTELELGAKSIYKWDKNYPSFDKVIKVANFFNVSIDSLVGNVITIEEYRENKPTDPYILLGEKAKEKGMPAEVLEKLIEFYTKK